MTNRAFYIWLFLLVCSPFRNFAQSDSLFYLFLEKHTLFTEAKQFATESTQPSWMTFRSNYRTESSDSTLRFLELHSELFQQDPVFTQSALTRFWNEKTNTERVKKLVLQHLNYPNIQRLNYYFTAPDSALSQLDSLSPLPLQEAYTEYKRYALKKPWKALFFAAILPGGGKIYRNERSAGFNNLLYHLALGGQFYESVLKRGWKAPLTLLNGGFLIGLYSINLFESVYELNQKKKEFLYNYYKTLETNFANESVEKSIDTTYDANYLALEKLIFNAPSKRETTSFLVQKFNLHLKNKHYERAVQLLYRIAPDLVDSSQKAHFLWNAALVSITHENETQGQSYVEDYLKLTGDSSTTTLLLQWLCLKRVDGKSLTSVYSTLCRRDTLFNGLEKYTLLQTEPNQPSMWASYLLPGSNLLQLKAYKEGVTALGLNGLVGLSLFHLLRNKLWINSIFWGLNMVNKFYFGQVRLATKRFSEKQEKARKQVEEKFYTYYKTVADKYPLSYKL